MTWAEFNDQVRVYLSVHNRRQGVQPLIDQWIRAGAVDLQTYIEYFRSTHVDILEESELTPSGYAHRGDLPDGEPLLFRVYETAVEDGDTPGCKYADLNLVPWPRIAQMICGEVEECPRVVALDPRGKSYVVAPALTATERLRVDWAGIKQSFTDDDVVAFDESSALAVSEYVMARLCRTVDRDLNLAMSYDQSYARERRKLYLKYQYRKFVPDDQLFHFAPPSGDSSWDNLLQTWDEITLTWDQLV